MMQDYSSSYGSSVTEEAKDVKHDSWLRSVRKQPISKPCKKAPVSPPMPPTPIKVYKVDPMNFRDLVQQLTGAPEFKPHHHHHHLQGVTPTPMPVSSFVDASSRDINATVATSPNFNYWPPQAPMSSNLYLQDLQADATGMGSKYQDISSTPWN